MATVRNNESAAHTIESNTVYGQVTFVPGVNIGVPDEAWESIKKHPVIKIWIEERRIEELSTEPTAKGELGGLEITELPTTDEPIPIMAPGLMGQPPNPVPEVEEFKRSNKKKVESE